MILETSKAPTARDSVGALGNVAHSQAINTRANTLCLADFQAAYIVQRARLTPATARVVASLAFGRLA